MKIIIDIFLPMSYHVQGDKYETEAMKMYHSKGISLLQKSQ